MITQIGSLPYRDVEKAVRYSLKHERLPFLPELPLLGDSMLEYIKNPGQLSCLNEWKEAVRGYGIVKIQCVGLVTLIQSKLYDRKDAMARICHHISHIVDNLNVGEIILFSDEPSLYTIDFDFDLKGHYEEWLEMVEVIGGNIQTPIVTGIHSCGDLTDKKELRRFDCLFESKIDILSVDASKYDITEYPAYRGNKRIAWGIKKASDVKDFQKGDLLTLPCGMSPEVYSVEDCEKNLEMLLRVSEEVYSSRGSN